MTLFLNFSYKVNNSNSYFYMGCYIDDSIRDLTFCSYNLFFGNNTIEDCIYYCITHGYVYAGVQAM